MTEKFEKEFEKAVIEEIQKYKWIESEKLGYDIGFERAAHEWAEKYGDAFEKYYKSMIEDKPAKKAAKKPAAKKTAKKAAAKKPAAKKPAAKKPAAKKPAAKKPVAKKPAVKKAAAKKPAAKKTTKKTTAKK